MGLKDLAVAGGILSVGVVGASYYKKDPNYIGECPSAINDQFIRAASNIPGVDIIKKDTMNSLRLKLSDGAVCDVSFK